MACGHRVQNTFTLYGSNYLKHIFNFFHQNYLAVHIWACFHFSSQHFVFLTHRLVLHGLAWRLKENNVEIRTLLFFCIMSKHNALVVWFFSAAFSNAEQLSIEQRDNMNSQIELKSSNGLHNYLTVLIPWTIKSPELIVYLETREIRH